MPAINFPYIDSELEALAAGKEPPGYWRAFHWGLYDDPENLDDDPERYVAAGEAMTEHIVSAAGVGDGTRVLDVGCGFGGTIDHVANRNTGVSLFGLNIDERQLVAARQLLAEHGRRPETSTTPFITADGCRLPVAAASLDHVLAVECIFHFPSRKTFLKEAGRVLRPGGTLALSDFVMGKGALAEVTTRVDALGLGPWFGRSARPPTSAGYEKMARAAGLDLIVDDDVTTRTLPTYPALRRLYQESNWPDGVSTVDGCEALARAGGWEYHVLAFRKRAGT
jgi:SAM-dependent methyltransferase